ncbi:Hypothetical predicted protein [Xyrichtys novacula]|uniref:Uncharacterized protein n=1 Tax=Xyrichtys novacula TaxID=13765 RepID=A0AAV1FNJ2_XYRNO|nr:Hypothetical predicted protein [Xyrichtys novacula]
MESHRDQAGGPSKTEANPSNQKKRSNQEAGLMNQRPNHPDQEGRHAEQEGRHAEQEGRHAEQEERQNQQGRIADLQRPEWHKVRRHKGRLKGLGGNLQEPGLGLDLFLRQQDNH